MKRELDLELAQIVVDFLNELAEIDRPAVAALIANRVPCNEELADHDTVQVSAQHGGFHVGMLGLLNGLCGAKEDSAGVIGAIFEDGANGGYRDLLRFEVLQSQESE